MGKLLFTFLTYTKFVKEVDFRKIMVYSRLLQACYVNF